MAYDGSSDAHGLKFYLDGEIPAHELISNNLKKSILHGVEGSNWSSFPLMLGKEKERSIKNVAMDQFQVYNRQCRKFFGKLTFHILSTNVQENRAQTLIAHPHRNKIKPPMLLCCTNQL